MKEKIEQFVWKAIPWLYVILMLSGVMFTWVPNEHTASTACSMVIFIAATLLVLYSTINELKKNNNDLKRELEEMKRKLEQ